MRTLTIIGGSLLLLVVGRRIARADAPGARHAARRAGGQSRAGGAADATLADPPADGAADAGHGRKLRDWSALYARPRTDGEGRRAEGHGPRVHHGLEGQQDLPGHRPQSARRGRAVHTPGRRLCSRAVRRRLAGAVHRRAGRHVAELPEQPAADPRQPHSREARAADGRRPGAQRRRRRPGQPARAGIRHRFGPLHRFHRDGSASRESRRTTGSRSPGIPKGARPWAAAPARPARSPWRGSTRSSIGACSRTPEPT